ncbi:uncharacterized protein N7500_006215 [Penicillium coprophilum]|uniref:uncharacterized protein n=1 Tax=Penicillium coprophilum TaxID=36646 RepID=UPI0023A4B5F1|nr:uncharacterized protein N7500_006215 [Penicillium coprophilum]KAJ5164385.1 hypothetical protein N7500_006215 [Penicillium coprophilum]
MTQIHLSCGGLSSGGDTATTTITITTSNSAGSGAGNVPQTTTNPLSSGGGNPSQINNSGASGVDNVPQSIILFRPAWAVTPKVVNNPLGPVVGARWRVARPDSFDPLQLPPDDDEITAPEIPTHDPDFLGEGEEEDEDILFGQALGDFAGGLDELGWEWEVREEDGPARPFSPGYYERLEAELDEIIGWQTDQPAEGSDSDREDVPHVTEVEDIADEARDGDEDAALEEA